MAEVAMQQRLAAELNDNDYKGKYSTTIYINNLLIVYPAIHPPQSMRENHPLGVGQPLSTKYSLPDARSTARIGKVEI
jgi:hypothetical protein